MKDLNHNNVVKLIKVNYLIFSNNLSREYHLKKIIL